MEKVGSENVPCPFIPLQYKTHFHVPESISNSKTTPFSGHLKLLLKYDYSKIQNEKQVIKKIHGLKYDPQSITIHSARIHVKISKSQGDFLAIPLKQTNLVFPTDTPENSSKASKKSTHSTTPNQLLSHDLILELDEETLLKQCPQNTESTDFVINSGFFSKSEAAMLEINFSAKSNLVNLQENSESSAKSCFTVINNNSLDSILTHFEPNFARSSFPCFDDETKRSTFELSLSYNPKSFSSAENLTFFSNMPIEKKVGSDIFFQKTPLIPTYLTCFGIGKFTKISTIESFCCKDNSFDISVFAHNSLSAPQMKEKSFINLEEIAQILKFGACFCASYFDYDFFLPKIDLVIVPTLCLGGMENLGCIFINKNVIFKTSQQTIGKTIKKSNFGEKKEENECISMILHEFVHQYIGNLLGMPFHLKEGLAQFFENKMLSIYLDSFRNPSFFSENNVSDVLCNLQSEIERKMIKRISNTNSNVNTSFLEEIKEQKNNNSNSNGVPSFGLCFNGATYEQAKQFVMERIERIGETELQKRLRLLTKSKAFQYVGADWL